jgi:spermidine/putrescine transport system permease protein
MKKLTLFVLVFLVLIYMPNIIIATFALNDSATLSLPLQGLTTRWLAALTHNDQMIDALLNSLRIAALTTLISTVLGAGAAYALSQPGFPLRRSFLGLLTLAIVAPVMILALALSLALQVIGAGLSLVTVLVGHVVLTLPFVIFVITARMEAFDVSLEQAARDLGLGPFGAFRRVWLPLASPGILSAALLAFTISFDDFMMSFFLIGADTTLPIFIWGQLRYPQKLPEVLALATLMFLASVVLIVAAEWLRRRGTSPNFSRVQA